MNRQSLLTSPAMEEDPDQLLGTWLGALEHLTMGLDAVKSAPGRACPLRQSKRLERYSRVNLEESAEVDLDALLGELCALENSFQPLPPVTTAIPRTHSPDSAFSDNVSMLSSESSASSAATRTDSSSSHSVASHSSDGLNHAQQQLRNSIRPLQQQPSELEPKCLPAEQAARIKAEKIKIALEKMREASVKKMFIKAISADGSAKSLLVEQRQTVGQVCRLLADKNHVPLDLRWSLVEHIPDLHMERIFEDHEKLVDSMLLWTRDSRNQLLFLSRPDKYDFFIRPELHLLSATSAERRAEFDEEARNSLLEEFFGATGLGVPEVEGCLYLKSDTKKAWKRYLFVLRASGLYYSPKGKSTKSKDLVCLATFESTNVYLGYGWKKKYKAPTEFGFAIKHPQIQTKSSKHIKYLCAESDLGLNKWVTGIRIAKYGRQLKDNFEALQREIAEEDLETLAQSRSFSVCSVSGSKSPVEEPPVQGYCTHIRRTDSVRSSASSSLSERSSSGTPTLEALAFEADCPGGGTIKRKPRIPLTTTTRTLAKAVEEPMESGSSTTTSSSSSGGSLGRHSSLRLSARHRPDVLFNSLSRRLLTVVPPEVSQTMERAHQRACPPEEILEILPPPPPADGTLGLRAPLPPPDEFRGSDSSLDSLPPPPPPLHEVPADDWVDALPPPPPTVASPPPPSSSSSSSCEASPAPTAPRQVRLRLDPLPAPRPKPPAPPQRSEATKLTSEPAFYHNLHRVMERKWKVAQQLQKDPQNSAHHILGFRDPAYHPPRKQPPPPPRRSDTTQLSSRT